MASDAQVGFTINGKKVSILTLQHVKILPMHEWQLRRAAPQHRFRQSSDRKAP
nr:hypothetical protein [uncultured Shimia sp.]